MALSIKNEEVDNLARQLSSMTQSCSALPSLDSRTDEEIVGYDLEGLPA